MTESDAVSVLMLLGLVSAGCIFAAGFAFGKHRGELETRRFFLLEDDYEEPQEWDPSSVIMIEDGHALYDQRSPGDMPTLTLIDGGKGKNR